ncbi:MAG: hypothetical protein ACRDZ2_16095 [Ilumatobacteraceae bacterium]
MGNHQLQTLRGDPQNPLSAWRGSPVETSRVVLRQCASGRSGTGTITSSSL